MSRHRNDLLLQFPHQGISTNPFREWCGESVITCATYEVFPYIFPFRPEIGSRNIDLQRLGVQIHFVFAAPVSASVYFTNGDNPFVSHVQMARGSSWMCRRAGNEDLLVFDSSGS